MIIKSLLDTDLYKLTMMQVVLHRFPSANVEYNFKCRTKDIDFKPFVDEIRQEIQAYCQLRFQPDELKYLSSVSYLKVDVIEFLRLYQPNPDYVEVKTENEFEVIIKGPWLHTIVFEVPLLAIISEVYMRNTHPQLDHSEGLKRLAGKIEFVQSQAADDFRFSDFGTRRRFSRDWQRIVVAQLQKNLPQQLVGTSNLLLAKELGLKPIGTMAHEYIQACQALGPRLRDSQRFAFENWAQEYRGDLGIALSDTYTINAFLNDFDLYFCKLFDGARQDSGDPIEWTERVLAHYEARKIDPTSKTLVYSDSLTFQKAMEIYQRFEGKVQMGFGIGTHLTNDLGVPAVDIVIKMVRCNNQAVAKLSDSPGKSICPDPEYLKYLKKVFDI